MCGKTQGGGGEAWRSAALEEGPGDGEAGAEVEEGLWLTAFDVAPARERSILGLTAVIIVMLVGDFLLVALSFRMLIHFILDSLTYCDVAREVFFFNVFSEKRTHQFSSLGTGRSRAAWPCFCSILPTPFLLLRVRHDHCGIENGGPCRPRTWAAGLLSW